MATLRRALYAQSGGVTAVINASACGLIEAARQHRDRIGGVYAARHGIVGVLAEDLIDTGRESAAAIAALRHTPGGAFGSCRFKLGVGEAGAAQVERLLAVLQAHDIGWFFYNGGGDSADTCLKVSALARERGLALQAIHVPKTVDNDLPHTDCCPGYGSVAKYVAVSTLEATLDLRSMAQTSTRVFVLEVMGRHTGWIAASAALVAERGLPVLILVPERAFDRDALLARVKREVDRHGFCSIVVAEGCRDRDGRFLAEAGGPDAFGHAQLGGAAPVVARMVQQGLGLKVHWAVADYLQRAARHLASRTDVRQAYALGRRAVQLALRGHDAVMPTVERLADRPYRWRLGMVALAKVANVERPLPRSFLRADGYGLSERGLRWLRPLVRGQEPPPFAADGLPATAALRLRAVPRRLPPYPAG